MNIFKNLRVLELSSVLAGPSVGMFFAELGAEVIKIENPKTGGDVTRNWKLPEEDQNSDISSYFCSVNWGKKSIALDLLNGKDYSVFTELVEKSDIITVSFKPGDSVKLKSDYDSIKKINSKIIYAEITGFGPDDERTAFDAVIQAYSGFMYMNGTHDSGPLKMPVALIDILSSHQIKEAVLIAYIERLKTGNGSHIHCSLLQSGIVSLANQASNYLNTGFIPKPVGSDHPNIFPYGTLFKTKDNKQIMLAIGNDKQYKKFCDIVDDKNVLDNKKYSTNPKRVQSKNELKVKIEGLIKKKNSNELINELNRERIPAALIYNMKEVFEQQQAVKLLLEGNKKNKKYHGVKTFCASINGATNFQMSPPPHLDENRKEILTILD